MGSTLVNDFLGYQLKKMFILIYFSITETLNTAILVTLEHTADYQLLSYLKTILLAATLSSLPKSTSSSVLVD